MRPDSNASLKLLKTKGSDNYLRKSYFGRAEGADGGAGKINRSPHTAREPKLPWI